MLRCSERYGPAAQLFHVAASRPRFTASDVSRASQGLYNKMATRVDQKLLRQTKFPPEFNQKVDMTKVNIEVMKK
jgi:serine/arginine repetitive matrix protein 1